MNSHGIFVVEVLIPYSHYHKTHIVGMTYISRAKQNREIKGPEYQLQAKITRVL